MSAGGKFIGLSAAARAYGFVFANFGLALRAMSLWLVLLLAAAGIFPDVENVPVEEGDFLLLLWFGAFLAASSAIAVAWHRFVLRGEPVSLLPFAPMPTLGYMLSVGVTLVVVLLIPMLIAVYLLSFSTPDKSSMFLDAASVRPFFLGEVALVFVLLGIALRFSLKLPALAIGDRAVTLRASWRKTARAWAGLLRGTLVILFPGLISLWLAIFVLGPSSSIVLVLTRVAVFSAVIFLFVMIYATFLSFAYRQTVGTADHLTSIFE